jgi:hypothetical protein
MTVVNKDTPFVAVASTKGLQRIAPSPQQKLSTLRADAPFLRIHLQDKQVDRR